MNHPDSDNSAAAPATPVQAEVLGHGKYGVQVSYAEGVARLTLRHVDRKFMPLWLFGRTVLTRMVRLVTPGEFEVTLRNTGAGLLCEGVRDGSTQPTSTVVLGPQWPIDVRESAREQIDAALHATGGKWGRALAVVSGVIVLLILLAGGADEPLRSTTGTPPAAAPQLTVAETDGMSSAELASKAAVEQASMPVMEAIAQAEKVELRGAAPGMRQIIVWSDPLCPNCRDLEQKVLGKLPAGVGVTIIPVSFKQGSRPLVSFVACGQGGAARSARWADLMSAEPAGDFSQQCPTGPAIADRNSVLFARAGLAATPTIMTDDGQAFVGDRTSVAAVANWIANQTAK